MEGENTKRTLIGNIVVPKICLPVAINRLSSRRVCLYDCLVLSEQTIRLVLLLMKIEKSAKEADKEVLPGHKADFVYI